MDLGSGPTEQRAPLYDVVQESLKVWGNVHHWQGRTQNAGATVIMQKHQLPLCRKLPSIRDKHLMQSLDGRIP